MLHLLDGAQSHNGDLETALENRIFYVTEVPLGGDVVLFQVVGNNGGIHVDAAQGVKGNDTTGAHLGNSPKA